MSDAIYAHPRLAPIYDAFDGGRDDLTAYLDLVDELGAQKVLDVGCGTGSLAVRLAARGLTVVGVDPAESSLRVARAKDPTVTWLHGDAAVIPDLDADLAVMTGNVAMVFLTDEDWSRTVHSVHRALRPGGHFIFETRRPERRAWEEWAANSDPVTVDVLGIGAVERRFEVTEVRLPFVSFRYTYRFLADGVVLTSDSTLRYREHDEVVDSLDGYRVRDVREAPDRPGREFVFVAERLP